MRRRRGVALALFVVGIALAGRARMASTPEPKPDQLQTIPREKGLPVVVRVALQFLEVTAIDENAEAFDATIDLRLRWQDPRLRYPESEAPRGFKEFRLDAVAAKLAEIWAPEVGIANLQGEPASRRRGLRLFPDGSIELMERIGGRFASPMDMQHFPFDRQRLEVEVVCQADGIEEVALESHRDDLAFANERTGLKAPGWDAGMVDVRADRLPGWHGDSHARQRVQLLVSRRPGAAAAAIFIPLFASLLIPLLALWLNRIEEGAFQIEAFELTNVIVGGLFAVIALNFTVNAEYRTLASGNNTVSSLFALNYVTLAVSLVANMMLFRFNVAKRLWGSFVQEELFLYLIWAVPLLALATAAAFLLVALA